MVEARQKVTHNIPGGARKERRRWKWKGEKSIFVSIHAHATEEETRDN